MSFVDPVYREEEGTGIRDISGLCLSGGGYRATLFHLGSLWRLNQTGHLRRLRRISSVSGGSITSAWLGLQWNKLIWENDTARNFEEIIVTPVRSMTNVTVDRRAILLGLVSPCSSAGDLVAKAYDRHLFKGATLQHLPDSGNGAAPRFIINATNLQTGALWRFSRRYMGDYRVGLLASPDIPLATAVAASSAFPPLLSPVNLDLSHLTFAVNDEQEFLDGDFRRTAILGDGGIYDNLGMETVWKRCRTVLFSDAGAAFPIEAKVPSDWLRHSIRVLGVIDNQVRSLRKREIVSELTKATDHDGAYWSIRSTPTDWRPTASATPEEAAKFNTALKAVRTALPYNADFAGRLAATPTRLKSMPEEKQKQLINLGYLAASAVLGIHHPGPRPNAPMAWPYSCGI